MHVCVVCVCVCAVCVCVCDVVVIACVLYCVCVICVVLYVYCACMYDACVSVCMSPHQTPSLSQILTIVAMLSVQTVFYRPKEKQSLADSKKAKFFQPEGVCVCVCVCVCV